VDETGARPPSIELGAFVLEEPIGRGGMSRVWRGVHRIEGTKVAIKLLIADPVKHRAYRDALQNEVRAMARLDHPGIVSLLDHGTVSVAASRASWGELGAKSPYLVMELIEGGTLRRDHVSSYADLTLALRALLEALAHAHAHGVVHRDLKPSNVLVDGARLRLSDFGIAHAIERAERGLSGTPMSAGTAWFMAPEQILGLHREEGPWTDLYALGCLAYLIVCQRLPYPGRDRERVYRSHCLAELPPLRPRFAVPSDLEAWIHVLLAKRPRDRFELAADALRALEQLGGTTLDPLDTAAEGQSAAPSEAMETRADASGTGVDTATPADLHRTRIELTRNYREGVGIGSIDGNALAARGEELRRASIPQISERAPAIERSRPARLRGIGLGIFGLRPIPLAGREPQRARLWDSLAEVARDREPMAIVLRGRAGYGKTRLAEWLAEIAVERGAAHALFAHHDATPSPIDGVTRMLHRYLRTEGLRGGELEQRLADVLSDVGAVERAQLAAVLAPSDESSPMRPSERFAIAREVLASASRRRPVIVVMDDVQYEAESIAFVDHLLRSGSPPVLAILTVREEALEERAAEAAALARLLERDRASEISLGPLASEPFAKLIEDLLGLEPSLAEHVALRTAGSPLFAVQLVGDWVQRGYLRAGERGFALEDGVDARIPDDIHALWSTRIDQLVLSMPRGEEDDAEAALAMLAISGRQVARAEWELACALANVVAPEDLLDEMANRRLAFVGLRRVTLAHGMLHESLERRAEGQSDLPRLHDACARMLARRYAGDPAHAERLAHHLLAAGRASEAIAPLLAAAELSLVRCEWTRMHALCARRAAILDDLGAAPNDPRRATAWTVEADAHGTRGLLDASDALLERVEPIARELGDRAFLSNVLRLYGGNHLKRGQLAHAHALFSEALELARAVGDPHAQALILHGLAEAQKLLGKIGPAEACYREACQVLSQIGDRLQWGRSRMGLGDVLRRRGDLDGAVIEIEEAIALMRSLGNRHSEGVGLNTLGDIARMRGRLEEAEQRYAQCIRVFDSIASEEAMIPRLNLALVLLARREYARARPIFESARPSLSERGREGYLSFVVAGSLVASAGLGDFGAAAELAREARALLESFSILDGDLADCFEAAGDLCRGVLAREVYALALAQWDGLELAARAAAVRTKLAAP
jgi:eukaryotic-like serine/threonine-protein kinase